MFWSRLPSFLPFFLYSFIYFYNTDVLRHPGWLTWRMSHILLCLIGSSWFHLTCGTRMLLFCSSSLIFMDDWVVIWWCIWWWWVTEAPEGSYKWPYNYEGFLEHLWCGRKIAWIVRDDEGPCSLVNDLRRGSTGPRRQRDLITFLAQERERNKSRKERQGVNT